MASLSTASLLWTILVAAPLARSQNLVMVLGKLEDLVEPSQLVVMPLVVERRCTPVTLLVWPARVERAAPVEVPHSLGVDTDVADLAVVSMEPVSTRWPSREAQRTVLVWPARRQAWVEEEVGADQGDTRRPVGEGVDLHHPVIGHRHQPGE